MCKHLLSLLTIKPVFFLNIYISYNKPEPAKPMHIIKKATAVQPFTNLTAMFLYAT